MCWIKRNGHPNLKAGLGTVIVGYEMPVRVNGPCGPYYVGRFWQRHTHDPYWPPPAEAVDPASIRVGEESISLPRL
jgi:hypothetical protein